MSLRTLLVPSLLALVACRGADGGGAGASHGVEDRSQLRLVAGTRAVVRGASLAAGETLHAPKGAKILPPVGADGNDGVLLLEDLRGVTIDLAGLDLRGSPAGTPLDRNRGVGIRLERCEDVTVRGGRIGGYKVCVLVRDSRRVVLEGLEFDGWYGARLRSTTQAEDPSDWIYPHENDAGEWNANYGAALSFEGSSDVVVERCRGRNGQNGILLTRTDGARIHHNDFSFLSGWGLALYRSSRNLVARNLFDYCVRGYSHEVYWRGQDSAGILMFERCSDNVIAENSATHGGDGLFLYAGHDLVEGRALARGEGDPGGCDRNVFYRNDFSFAVANAIEATFSRDNWAIENRLDGSHMHGVWGGYSERLVVLRNSIRGTVGGGISIEHGQECWIEENHLEGGDQGVELWWDDDPFASGPYGKQRDTASRDHVIVQNRFVANAQDVSITKTTGIAWSDNVYESTSGKLTYDKLSLAGDNKSDRDPADLLSDLDGNRPSGRIVESSLREWDGLQPEWLRKAHEWQCPPLPGEPITFARERGEREGLDTIVMGEWGPWDFRSNAPRPKQRDAGGLLAKTAWDASWFSWKGEAGPDPRHDVDAWRSLAGEPLAQARVGAWTNPWGGDAGVRAAVGNDHFGLLARASFELREAGPYALVVTSDDGVRVSIDGRVVLENWTWHAPTRDVAELTLEAGTHSIEVEYFQIDGASALSIDLERAGR